LCVILQHVFAWIRFVMMYQEAQRQKPSEPSDTDYTYDVFFWVIYVIFPAFGVLFLPFQIFYIVREIQHDLLWYRKWFIRVYAMFVFILFMNMFGVQGYMVFFYVFNDDFVNPLDFVDGLIGSVGLVTFTIMLHRDACCPCVKRIFEPRSPEQVRRSTDTSETRFQGTHKYATETVEWTSETSEKAAVGTVTIHAPRTSLAGSFDVDSACCNRRVALVIATALCLVYIGLYVSIVVLAGYRYACTRVIH